MAWQHRFLVAVALAAVAVFAAGYENAHAQTAVSETWRSNTLTTNSGGANFLVTTTSPGVGRVYALAGEDDAGRARVIRTDEEGRVRCAPRPPHVVKVIDAAGASWTGSDDGHGTITVAVALGAPLAAGTWWGVSGAAAGIVLCAVAWFASRRRP